MTRSSFSLRLFTPYRRDLRASVVALENPPAFLPFADRQQMTDRPTALRSNPTASGSVMRSNHTLSKVALANFVMTVRRRRRRRLRQPC